jgi:hypothetical protein
VADHLGREHALQGRPLSLWSRLETVGQTQAGGTGGLFTCPSAGNGSGFCAICNTNDRIGRNSFKLTGSQERYR